MPYPKGKPRSEETKKKMKASHAYRIGSHFKHTEETKTKVREARIFQTMRNKKPALMPV